MFEELVFISFILASRVLFYVFKANTALQALHKKNISPKDQVHVLVIAHPDDESMFFSPLLFSLEKFYILCLSNGSNGDKKLGKIRQAELDFVLQKSYNFSDDDLKKRRIVLDKETLQDGMNNRWKPGEIATEIAKFVSQFVIEDESKEIVLVSFDSHGVSLHPNHVATSLGCEGFCFSKGQKLLQLKTLSWWEKYLWWFLLSEKKWKYKKPDEDMWFSPSSSNAYTALSGHRSQFVWYRRLFISYSSYSVYNIFKIRSPNPAPRT